MNLTHFQEAIDAVGNFIRTGDGQFDALALALFRLQAEQVPTLKHLCKARGINPEEIRSWQEIPAIPTTAFRDFEISSLDSSERTTVFHSSGTTSTKPSRHWHDSASLKLYHDSLIPSFREHLGDDDFQFISLTPPPTAAPNSSLVHMMDAVSRGQCRFLGKATPEGWDIPQETQKPAWFESSPVCLMGPAYGFVQWFDYLTEKAPLPNGSVVMETGGYKGRTRELPKAQLHRMICNTLDVSPNQIVSEYGMCELSSQAYDLTAGATSRRNFHFPPWAKSLVIDGETGTIASQGKTGLLRIIDLANVRSVIGVQTQDLAVQHEDGFELIGRASNMEARGCSLNLENS